MRIAQIGEAARGRAGAATDKALAALQLAGRLIGRRRRTDGGIEPVAGPTEPAHLLDDSHAPPGDVARQLLEQCDGALAPAVVDRLGDIDPSAAGVEAGDEVGGQEIADVVDDPVVARLDRLVLPEPIDAPPDRPLTCGADAGDELAERAGLVDALGVLGAVDLGQELPQLLRVPGLVAVGVSGPWRLTSAVTCRFSLCRR